MKLNNKVLIGIALTLIPIISLSYFESSYVTKAAYTLLTLSFFISLYALLRIQFIKPMENLVKKINPQSNSNIDEVKFITNEVNILLKNINEKMVTEQTLQEKNQTLKEQISNLKQEINNHTYLQKKLTQEKHFASKLTYHDSLTALPNRVFFNEILNKSISHAKRHNKIIALLHIDIDKFKDFNANLGHQVADQILKETAIRFGATLRSEDILAKLDEDEFIVLLNDIHKPKFASTVANKLLKACEKPIKINSHEYRITASIGISIYPTDGETIDQLHKNAEAALQVAKESGGNTYHFYAQEFHMQASEYLQLESALRQAIKNDELSLYFQPKIHLKDGKISGVEALIRWTHPELGAISPSKFIPIAEESGLMMDIGKWAINEACKLNKYWQNEGYEHLSIAIKISPKQFYHSDFPEILANILNHNNLHPKYLELEIAENVVMENSTTVQEILTHLKATGVQLGIDHFGSGYVSITHLKEFPISFIKIDKSFINGLPYHVNDMAIINAIIGLAHHLGLQVIAEGVENSEQLQYLGENNCDMVQGYFLSHPISAEKIVEQFKKLEEQALVT